MPEEIKPGSISVEEFTLFTDKNQEFEEFSCKRFREDY